MKTTTNERFRMRDGATRFIIGTCLLAGMSIPGRAQPASAAAPGSGDQFEPASALVPAGNTCAIHPEGNSDPGQTLTVRSDEDGVIRFLAARPRLPGSVERLALDCTDSTGVAQTYSVDLRSEDAFAPRPFNPSLTTLAFRPALTGDPLSYTQQELIHAGYGPRPDPNQNPDGYKRWLAAASTPVYKLRTHRTWPSVASVRRQPIPRRTAHPLEPEIASNIHLGSPFFWTGAIMTGSYSVGTTAAQTYSYVENEASFTVPTVYKGAYNTGTTQMSIWNGLDNGLGGPGLLQAVTWLYATPSTASFSIHHQEFSPWTAGNDNADITFTPKSGDSIYAVEWYCDAKGNLNLSGGYACTLMVDETQGISWDCSQAGSSDCPSYTLKSADLANGVLGETAQFIIEYDTGSTAGPGHWPDFSPVTMSGSAFVVKGNGTSGTGQWVTTTGSGTSPCSNSSPCPDPYVLLQPDPTQGFPRGNGHLLIIVPNGGVKWEEVMTNVYDWNGTNFNSFSPGCATSVAVGPNSHGLTNGTPWIVSCASYLGGEDFTDGNQSVWQMQDDGYWVKMEKDAATAVAVSPEGKAWAIDAKGEVLYWDGSAFTVLSAPGGVCARAIAVGPSSGSLTNGTPWIVGCSQDTAGNSSVYQLQTSGSSGFVLMSWVKMQGNVAMQIAVSPEGIPWAINASGQVLYWNGTKFVASAGAPCAISIGVGPNSFGLTNGTPWIVGCTAHPDTNFDVYQMQTGATWVKMQADVGYLTAVSPDAGIPWVISGASSGAPPTAQAGSRWP
jgi:hypothetical protein